MEVERIAISRKKVLEKIAGRRKAIDYHLDDHIPSLIHGADQGRIEYWRKEVQALITEMEQWAFRLSNNEVVLEDVAEYRLRLEALLNARLDELNN